MPTLALPAPAAPAPAGGESPALLPDEWLAAVALTEADLPPNLKLYSRSPGLPEGAGVAPRYEALFLADALPTASASAPLISVYNVVVGASPWAPSVERLLDDAQQDWGTTIAVVAPAVGEESRAAATVPRPDLTPPYTTTAGIAFRRGPLLVLVAVSALSDAPPVGEAVRLAQLLDARAAEGR